MAPLVTCHSQLTDLGSLDHWRSAGGEHAALLIYQFILVLGPPWPRALPNPRHVVSSDGCIWGFWKGGGEVGGEFGMI